MTQHFPFFEFCEEMASSLTLIRHSSIHHRFFKASGGELFTSLDDSLSSVDSAVLIGIDKAESLTERNHADGLSQTCGFAIIIALPTNDNVTDTICSAVDISKSNVNQIRNVLISRYGNLITKYETYPSGVIGDNFYGSVLEFSIADFSDYTVDSSFFIDPSSSSDASQTS